MLNVHIKIIALKRVNLLREFEFHFDTRQEYIKAGNEKRIADEKREKALKEQEKNKTASIKKSNDPLQSFKDSQNTLLNKKAGLGEDNIDMFEDKNQFFDNDSLLQNISTTNQTMASSSTSMISQNSVVQPVPTANFGNDDQCVPKINPNAVNQRAPKINQNVVNQHAPMINHGSINPQSTAMNVAQRKSMFMNNSFINNRF